LATSALTLSGVDAYYGDSHVLEKVSFTLGEGRLLGLLGRNGAGKSTCMNVTVGLLAPRAGSVAVFGAAVTRLPPEKIAAHGVALVPQGRRIFKSLTVRENLIVAARRSEGRDGRAPWTVESVFARFPRLRERSGQMAAHLSGGEQQMLAMARALMGRPKLILMDEPTMGLSPLWVDRVLDLVSAINQQGTTIFMVEQNANLALQIAHDAYVLQTGRIVLQGAATELRNDPRIRDAYLGGALAA